MADGTRADYELIATHDAHNASRTAERMIALLKSMDGPSPYPISRLQHVLQSATRAEADGADDETIAVALLHDIGDQISPHNHSQVAAAILKPYVSERNWWIVQHHGLFQGYYWFAHYQRDPNERDRYVDHPHYQACVDFCERWDQNCFDPDYPTKTLAHFEPLVRQLFATAKSEFV
ncbi:MAG: HD domain-containing protein [Gammaproteobacteria bacterium]|nr:HD domain-containing protein [Gammaproteobacteria bacterium]MYF50202.1 HD domain-containing protein [Gammaproteobacteria bacterium]MYG11947.1 HD domain-containing protein [Gammaproteobacteria bacterium]MYK28047.1 HD domain-containing protein [Gammaproteobacteria bacterium]